jgi:Tfp pilus assembly protein FimT
MTSQHLDALARDLESRGRFAEAEAIRLRIASVPVSVEVGRAARDAETRGDWRRWAELLATVQAAG